MDDHDSYLVYRDAILSVVERYITHNDYLDREELAALIGIALPKKQPAQPDPELEALKQVLAPDAPLKPEPVKFCPPEIGAHCQKCVNKLPTCICLTCANDDHDGGKATEKSDGSEPCCCNDDHERVCADLTFCPDYVPEAPHDPLP